MKKQVNQWRSGGSLLKFDLKMKLTTLLLMSTFFGLYANDSYAQKTKVTLDVENATVRNVLDDIESMTDFLFVYKVKDVDLERKVLLKANKEHIETILKSLFQNTDTSYKIRGTQIILRQNPDSSKEVPKQTQIENSQDKFKISGTVTDENGAPLPGANIIEKGTTNGVQSDFDGNYSIELSQDNATLVFSYIGYVSKEVSVNNQNNIDVILGADVDALDEVVVVGYGTQKKINLTGAIDQVKSKEIEAKPVMNVLQALQGEAPNLIIQQTSQDPGSGVNLNIRGLGTLGDNTPLLVIDGVIGGDINQINPNDVASVSVLKDAGSAAIYGSRAANGVILVTTKTGRLNKKPVISYNVTSGMQHPAVLLEKVDAWDNAEYKNASLTNSGLPVAYTDEQIQQFKSQGNGTWDAEHILKSAPLQTHNLSISGGSENNSYFISGAYLNQASNLIGNGGSGSDFGYQKYNLRLNQTSIIGKLKVNVILNYNKNRNKKSSANQDFLFADANRLPYQYSFQDSAGNYLTNPLSSQSNPLGILKKGGYNQTDNNQIFGNLNGTLSIGKGLKLTGLFGATLINNSSFFRTIEVDDWVPSGISGDDRRVRDNSVKSLLSNSQLYAEYDKSIKMNTFKALLGISNESFTQKGFQLQQQYTDPYLGIPTTGTIIEANNSYNSNSATTQTSINSLFGRLSYSYNSRYFLEGTFRVDGSSKFAEAARWGFFPSIGGSWLATDEPFMQSIKETVNTLKIRTSYGVLGNQNVNAYQYRTTYSPYENAYGFNNMVVNGADYVLGNPDLTWEKSAMYNLGIDAAFFNNNLSVSFDVFNKVTSDILYGRQDVPALYGAVLPDFNVAKVRDRGWEATVGYHLQTGQLSHAFNFNISNSNNTLLSLSYGTDQQINNRGEFAYIRKVGSPITQYYSYKVIGIFQTEDEINNSAIPAGVSLSPGDSKFFDANNDGIIDSEDRVPLGDPFPHYTYGFTYSSAFKGFDLSIFIQGVGKRSAMIRGELVEPYQHNYGATLFEHQLDFWTPSNPNARYPRLSAIGSNSEANNWLNESTNYLFNAAYARLKNVNIGYTLSEKISEKLGIDKLRLSFIGQNLFTLSKLDWVDPETSRFNNNVDLSAGSNSARGYPMPVTYSIGLDVTL